MKSHPEILTEPEIINSFFIEKFEKSPGNVEIPTRLSYHKILLIESGTGKISIDHQSFDVLENEVFLMSKGQIYSFENQSNISGFSLSFGGCFWEKTPQSASNCKAVLFDNASANQLLNLDDDETGDLSFLFTIMLNEFSKPPYINHMDALAAYLKIIMIKLANVKLKNDTTFESPDDILYRRFLEFLSAGYRTNHTVNSYADMLNITPRRLNEICKRCSGTNAKEIINGHIISEAKRLLQFSSKTVKEIAYDLNFKTAEQFSHFFKKNTKTAPADYRKAFVDIGVQ